MLPLPAPPSFEYESTGPYLVNHLYGKRPQTWMLANLIAAVRRMWMLPDPAMMPDRRTVVDAFGVTILGVSLRAETSPKVVGTRETCNIMLASDTTGETVDMLWLVDMLTSMGGVAF